MAAGTGRAVSGRAARARGGAEALLWEWAACPRPGPCWAGLVHRWPRGRARPHPQQRGSRHGVPRVANQRLVEVRGRAASSLGPARGSPQPCTPFKQTSVCAPLKGRPSKSWTGFMVGTATGQGSHSEAGTRAAKLWPARAPILEQSAVLRVQVVRILATPFAGPQSSGGNARWQLGGWSQEAGRSRCGTMWRRQVRRRHQQASDRACTQKDTLLVGENRATRGGPCCYAQPRHRSLTIK